MRKISAILPALLLLTFLPSFASDEALTTYSRGKVPIRWVETLSQNEARIFTLTECSRLGLDNSFKLEGHDSAVRYDREKVKETLSARNPHVSMSGVSTYQQPTIFVNFPPTMSPAGPIPGATAIIAPEWYHNYAVSATKLLTSFGKVEAAAKVSAMNEDIEKSKKRMESEGILLSITQGFYGVIYAQEMLDVARADVNYWKEQRSVTESLYKNGVVARYDLLRVDTALSRAKDQVETGKKNLEIARGNLRTLMGLAPDEKIDVMEKATVWNGEEEERMAFTLQKWQELSLVNNPAIQLGMNARRQGEYALELARLENAPDFSIQTSYVKETQTFVGKDWAWRNSVMLSIPIVDGGEKNSKINQALELIKQADLNIADTKRNVLWGVEQAYRELHDQYPKIKTAKEQLNTAREGFRLARVRYREGLGTMVEVIDAENSFIQARENLEGTLYRYHAQMAALSYAVGILEEDIFSKGEKSI